MKVLSNGEKEFSLETEGELVVVCGLPESTRMEKGLPFDQIRIGSLLNIGEQDLQDIADNAALAPGERQEGDDEDA